MSLDGTQQPAKFDKKLSRIIFCSTYAYDPDCVKTPIYVRYGLHKPIYEVLGLRFIDYFVCGFYPVKAKSAIQR